MSRKQSVLVFGSRGQIGSALLRSLPEKYDAIGLSSSQLDLTDESQLRECIRTTKPDIIINAAAYTMVDKAESEQELAYLVNATAPKIIAEEAERLKARVVHYSTDYVFDGQTNRPYEPTAEKNPLSIYGKSKSDGEDSMLAEMSNDRLHIMRTSWIYAKEGRNFVNTILNRMQKGQSLRVVCDQVGAPTSAVSAAAATWKAVEFDVTGIHHFTDAGVASWYDFASVTHCLAHEAGRVSKKIEIEPISSSEYPQKAERPRFSILNSLYFLRTVGMTPQHWSNRLKGVFFE